MEKTTFNSRVKIITAGGLAKRLLGMGHVISSLRPKKENVRESIFIFYRDRWLDEDISFCMSNKSGEDEILNERLKSLKMTKWEYMAMICSDYISDKAITA